MLVAAILAITVPCIATPNGAPQSAGTAFAWGSNTYGQLGNGTTTNSSTPVQVSSLGGVVAIVGGSIHSLALKSDGTVRAWGYNGDGELGNGTTTNSSTPVQVVSLSGVLSIAAGAGHTLALKSDGTVRAWGYNGDGELGNGTTTNSSTPVQVNGLSGAVSVAGGDFHSLALKSDGTVWAWGYNGYGQLGNGTTTHSSTPVQVSTLSGVVAIAGGSNHSLALKSDGTVWAWGYNGYGQLGNGTTTNSSTPVQVSGLSDVVAIAASSHSLAIKGDGTAWAWGTNAYGQLGTGGTTNSSTPVQVSSLSGAVSVAGGGLHTLALKSDSTVWAWGFNYYGQLGTGTTTNSSTPVQVSSLSGVAAIAGGSNHSLALSVPAFTTPTLLPGAINFGSRLIYSSNTESVTLTNNSTVALSIQQVSISGSFTQSNNCPTTLAPGSSCSFTVSFAPTALGDQSGILSVEHDGVGTSPQASLSATATDLSLALSRPSRPDRSQVNIVVVGQEARVGVLVSAGTAPATVAIACLGTSGITCSAEPNIMQLTGEPALATVVIHSDSGAGPGLYNVQVIAEVQSRRASLTVPIELIADLTQPMTPAPVLLAPAAPAFVSRSSAVQTSSIAIRPLPSVVVPDPPALAVSPGRLVFEAGTSKSHEVRTVRFANMQSVPLTISTIEVTEDFVYEADCGAELAAGGSCEIKIRLRPSATREHNGTLTIITNSGKATVALVVKVFPSVTGR
jgi:alpha-tubulin suppressor-like RCC1 family protein